MCGLIRCPGEIVSLELMMLDGVIWCHGEIPDQSDDIRTTPESRSRHPKGDLVRDARTQVPMKRTAEEQRFAVSVAKHTATVTDPWRLSKTVITESRTQTENVPMRSPGNCPLAVKQDSDYRKPNASRKCTNCPWAHGARFLGCTYHQLWRETLKISVTQDITLKEARS